MKKVLRNAALFLALGAAVWLLVFRKLSPEEVRRAAADANWLWLLAAVAAMGLYFVCDAANTRRGLRCLGHRPGFARCLQYAATGFFFSSVTPSASGGQPMQICAMRRQGIDPAHGALVLLLELGCWQAVNLVYGATGFFLLGRTLPELSLPLLLVAALGLAVNLLALGAVAAAVLKPQWAHRLGRKLTANPDRHPRTARLRQRIAAQLEQYAGSAPVIRAHPAMVAAMLLTTAVQLFCLYSVPYWVARSLGLSGASLPMIAAAQAALSLSVGALPLPGAMGVGESGFLTVFKTLFPAQLLGGAMVLSRGVSFYLFVALTGLALLLIRIVDRIRTSPGAAYS